jgi:hypothetical protein
VLLSKVLCLPSRLLLSPELRIILCSINILFNERVANQVKTPRPVTPTIAFSPFPRSTGATNSAKQIGERFAARRNSGRSLVLTLALTSAIDNVAPLVLHTSSLSNFATITSRFPSNRESLLRSFLTREVIYRNATHSSQCDPFPPGCQGLSHLIRISSQQPALTGLIPGVKHMPTLIMSQFEIIESQGQVSSNRLGDSRRNRVTRFKSPWVI